MADYDEAYEDEFYDDAAAKVQERRLWYVQFLIILAFGEAFLDPVRNHTNTAGWTKYFSRAMSLLPDITGVPVVATDAGGSSISGLLAASATAFVLGAPLNTDALFAHRFSRELDLDWQPSFLVNPCELAPLPGIEREILLSHLSMRHLRQSPRFACAQGI